MNAIREKAEKCIAIGLSDIALVVIRRGAEGIAKQAYSVTNNERNGRASHKLMLHKLLLAIKDFVPEGLTRLLYIFQTFGNLAAHSQEGDESPISDELAMSVAVLYEYADGVFRGWLDQRDGTSETQRDAAGPS
jgi:hypothetical protein